MLNYRLKSKLDGSYHQEDNIYPLHHATIWTSKKKLYEFFINCTLKRFQFLNLVYLIERENTRSGKVVTFEITKFFNFF